MAYPQLKAYIAQRTAEGAGTEAIGAELLATGWAASDVREAFGFPRATEDTIGSGGGRKRLAAVGIAVLFLLAAGGASFYVFGAHGKKPVDGATANKILQATATPASAAAGQPEGDRDGDGLSDADESKYGSDPDKADTDGDGYADGAEVANGYDPAGPGKLKP